MLKRKEIYPTDVSKHGSNRQKQIGSLIILSGEEWYYIEVKQLPTLLKGMVIFAIL